MRRVPRTWGETGVELATCVLRKIEVNGVAINRLACRNVQYVTASERNVPVGAPHDGWAALLKADEDIVEAHRLRAEHVREAQANAPGQEVRERQARAETSA